MSNRTNRPDREPDAPSVADHDPQLVAYLFIANGFDEQAMRATQTAARRAGLAPILVAQTVQRVIGNEGTATQAGLTFERVRDRRLPHAILLLSAPGGATAFVADPRLSRFLSTALNKDVVVGAFPGNLDWLTRLADDVGPGAAAVISQGARSTPAFLAEVFEQVKRKGAQAPDTGTHPLTRVP